MSQRSVLLDKSTQTDRVIDRGFHQFTQTDNLALYARLNYTSVKDGVTYGLVEFATLQRNVPATARYQLLQSQASQQVEPLDGTGSRRRREPRTRRRRDQHSDCQVGRLLHAEADR